MNQEFSVKNLMNFARKKDEYLIGEVDELKLENIEETIFNESFQFSDFKIINKYVNLLDIDIHELLVLRKLNYNIKKLYKIKQSDRNSIVKQVNTLLQETSRDIFVTRLDIKNFYGSINIESILTKLLKNDYLLSYHSKFILKHLFMEHNQFINHKGLPFGLNLSATLSELYMRNFDNKMKSLNGIYYYSRYVDDIIIFSYIDLDIVDIIKKEKILPKELSLNMDKYKYLKIFGTSDFTLDFLGYKFDCTNKNLNITISENKVRKIKTRMIKSFLDFYKNKRFELLNDRIKFITGNYTIYKNENRSLNGGLSYNYNLVNENSIFLELDTFLVKTIFSKSGSLGKKNCLTRLQKNQLKKYSFLFSFQNNVLHKFSRNNHSHIKRCW